MICARGFCHGHFYVGQQKMDLLIGCSMLYYYEYFRHIQEDVHAF